jgi:hypothetical protein
MTIFWLVIAVIIFSIDRHANKRIAHIGVEVLELQPTVADCYSASAVIVEILIVFIETAAQHLRPRAVCPGKAFAMLEVCF